jgi:cysteine-rich repeat protein
MLRLYPACVLAIVALLRGATVAGATVAADLCGPAADPCVVNSSVTIDPGSTIDLGTRKLQFGASARVAVSGTVSFTSGAVELLPGAQINGRGATMGATITFNTLDGIAVDASGSTRAVIDVSSDGEGGFIDFEAAGDITIAGNLLADGNATFATGGVIMLNTTTGKVSVTGTLDAHGPSGGGGGEIDIGAGAGGVDLQAPINLTGSDGGGGFLSVVSDGDVFLRQKIDVSGGGDGGEGGEIDVTSNLGSITLAGTIAGQGASVPADEGGAGGGASVTLQAQNAVTISGLVTITGGSPDGEGGDFEADAGTTITQSNAIVADGNGVDGFGGSVTYNAGGNVTTNKISLIGGSIGGGAVSVTTLGDVTIPQSIIGDAGGSSLEGYGQGGSVSVSGRNVTVSAVVRMNSASQFDLGAAGGLIALQGCNVTETATGELRAVGPLGSIDLAASGQLTVAGKVLGATSVPPTAITFRYRDPLHPPITAGATITPAAVVTPDPTLPPCPSAGAFCGDGNVDPNEQCDDGNATSCDGCSNICQTEGCGNGKVECAEQCDNGLLNGTPGNACASDCTIVPTETGVMMIPGGRTGNACIAEWAVENPHGAIGTDGFPSVFQHCVDGDPTCDQDGVTNGTCAFQVGICLAPTDTRLSSCQPLGVASVSVNTPNPLNVTAPADVAIANALKDALAATGVTVKAGSNVLVAGTNVMGRDHCTENVTIEVPRSGTLSGTRTLQIAAKNTSGGRMRHNQFSLVCDANPAVCGNGAVELGEQCDDGNHNDCDGCTSQCRLQGCGDGVVSCGEECDDGAANGSEASECTAQCTVKVPPLRIPGGGSPSLDCQVEFAMRLGTPAVDGKGIPAKVQRCVDNDPTCDSDPTVGNCRYQLWACLGGADARLACPQPNVAQVSVLKPNLRAVGALGTLRRDLAQSLAAVPLPTTNGEVCAKRVDVDVPVGRKPLPIGIKTKNTAGKADRDTLKLYCSPAGS